MSSSRPRLPTRVVAPPSGVSVGSRLRLTDWERGLLTAVGAHLSRARAADLALAQRGERANDRQKALSARFGIHSRYAGSICVDNDAAVRAVKEQLWSHQLRLQAAVRHLEARTALPSKAASCGCRKRRCERCGDGYATENERVMPHQPALTLQQARLGGVVGVDLNADHLAAARLDEAGNPIGRPVRIPLELDGLPTTTRDARLREAITALLAFARHMGSRAVAVEELGFTDDTTREKHGRNRRFRRLLSGFPTLAFRTRLAAMAATAGLAVVSVDPRYTSRVGGRDWQRVLAGGPTAASASQTSVTRHDGAAVAIGRRALALGLTAGPRGPERRSAPHQRRRPGTRLAGRGDGSTSSRAAPVRAPGTPTRPTTRDRAGAKAARRTPAAVSAPVPPAPGGRGPGETTHRTGRTPRISSAAPPAPPG